MNGSLLRRTAVLIAGIGAAPLALAQGTAANVPPWSFIATMAGLGLLFAFGIVTVVHTTANRKQRERLATVERLVNAGKPVPQELMTGQPAPLPLPEERRRDIRRGITLLCGAIAVGLLFYILSSGNLRAAAWGLLWLVPALGNFLKAWLTAREIAGGAAGGTR
jgi:hypothetical protein